MIWNKINKLIFLKQFPNAILNLKFKERYYYFIEKAELNYKWINFDEALII